MSCQDYEAQIGDYADGTMDEAQRASCESHLATCASCRALASDFSVIRAASLTLEAQVPPPHVWRKLSAAIEAEPKPLLGLGGAYWWRVLAPVAAMVVLVAALSWTAGRLTPVANERLARVAPGSGSEPVTIAAEYQLAEQDLTNTIVGLERIADDRSTLDMETADVLKANLTVLDGAIGESRDALQKEPENDVAQESLFEALRSKIALLQDTIALINEMRKGNQEGAARIVSGLNQ
jgi:Putative zinc-finger